tara:strand:- start:598 stop:810 length:213 start_codon:yes stop_codon:yes gene_type:complete
MIPTFDNYLTEAKRLSFKDAQIDNLMDLKRTMDILKDANIDWDQSGQSLIFNSSAELKKAKIALELNENS